MKNQIERAEPSRGAPDAQRKAFENWAQGPQLPLERDGILYAEYMTQLAWMSWQGAASGHVVLLDALKAAVAWNYGRINRSVEWRPAWVDLAEAAIKQAERT